MRLSFKVSLAFIAVAIIASAFYFARPRDNAEASSLPLAQQIASGERVFNDNCLVCHGEFGAGSANWRQRDVVGNFPPPPLNGTAHTWHHSLATLTAIIKRGGARAGGTMPSFAGQLSDSEIEDVIQYLVNLWPAEIREKWENDIKHR